MAPRLKVFVTSDGLTDYAVAVSSRPKALAAWGVRQDLFKERRAAESSDAGLAKAALARPGEVVSRARDLPAVPSGRSRQDPAARRKPSAAARRRLKALERRLAGLEETHARRLADLSAERGRLAKEEREMRQAQHAEKTALEQEIAAARKAAGDLDQGDGT